MKLTDLPGELRAACLARASGGDPAALLAACAAHLPLLRPVGRILPAAGRPAKRSPAALSAASRLLQALGCLEHFRLDKPAVQRRGQSARAPERVPDDQARRRKLEHQLLALAESGALRRPCGRQAPGTAGERSRLTRLTLLACTGVQADGLRHPCRLCFPLLHTHQRTFLLHALDLSFSLRGQDPQALQRMHSLRELRLFYSAITDATLILIAGNLRVLAASFCQEFSNAICPLLTACEELDVRCTSITGQGLQLLAGSTPPSCAS